MTDLTEQWKKGEFIICNARKCQYYYVQNEEQKEVIKTEYCLFDDNTPNWKILAPVPSYEEWQASEKYNKHLEEVIKIYERKDKQATETSIAYNKLLEENAQLKELLKEYKDITAIALLYTKDDKEFEKAKNIIERIDEVLK